MANNNAYNGVTHAIIAMLIIGIVMCFASNKSYNTTHQSINITLISEYVSDTMISCITRCEKRHLFNPIMRVKCLEACCDIECHKWYPNDNKRFNNCTKIFYKLYVR
ncbi:uncharacterized protein DS421_9g262100 [Arachis hypogaea]|nr:uncharacterized protein DS421_9g262100 [Arachis hypogaea]